MKKSLSQKKPLVLISFAPNSQNLRFGEKIAYQSQFAMQLLEKHFCEFFGKKLSNSNFQIEKNGRWVCDCGHISVSHSGSFVAVALSCQPIGIDLQRFSGDKVMSVAEKFFTETEKQQLALAENKMDFFYFTWCKKEALWKSLANQPPTVTTVDTTVDTFTLKKLQLNGETFYFASTGNAEINLL